MSTKTPGYLVETASGKGRTYHSENLVNGKIVVHLLGPDLQTPIVENGKEKKILVDRNKIKMLGFID